MLTLTLGKEERGGDRLKVGHQWVFWFGDRRISQVQEQNILPFLKTFNKCFHEKSGMTYRHGVMQAVQVLLENCTMEMKPVFTSEMDALHWAATYYQHTSSSSVPKHGNIDDTIIKDASALVDDLQSIEGFCHRNASGHSARATADNICAAFKGNVVHYSTVSRWLKCFESGGTTFRDRPRSEHPSTVDDEALRNALNAKPNSTTCELATTLGVTHMAIGNHLNDLGYWKVYSTWVPHQLSVALSINNMCICSKRHGTHDPP
ncbi:unnamed protein product [Darwinula stevensoni]|uniref:Mos1 transposase HTH domain-containing protein n=1 Tax=Darwinula stevensoni TaxID=69355 RepID=A0A7R8WZ05_9CRUS|nr:unnamed protein product [Darwinula stevensoni]CAG0880022.1 unnamed protein product [Darwinula stevensoni]